MLLGPDGQPPPVPAGDRFIYHKGSPVPELAPDGAAPSK
jgi:hypothetical protein